MVGVVVLSENGNGASDTSTWNATADAVNERNASDFIISLDEDPTDPELVELVQSVFGALPEGTAVSVASFREGTPDGDIRTDSVEFRVSTPGASDRVVPLSVIRTKTADGWEIQAVIPGGG